MLKRISWFSEKLLPYSVYLLILTTILLPKFPISDVAGTYVKIRYDDLLNALVYAIWFLTFSWLSKDFFRKTINRTIFLYWLIGFISSISAIYITQVSPEKLTYLSWLRRIEYMGFFFVGVSATPNFATAIRYVYALFLSTALAIVYGLGQIYFGWCSISTTNREFSKGICVPLTNNARPNSTFAGHYDLAIFLSFIAPVILASIFMARRYWQWILGGLLLIATLWMLVQTRSQTAYVATLFTVAAFIWFRGKKMWLLGFLIVALLITGVFGKKLVTRYQTTILSITTRLTQPKHEVRLPVEDLIKRTTSEGGEKLSTSSAIPGQENLPDEALYRRLHPRNVAAEANPTFETNLSNNIRFNEEWPRALRGFYRNPLLGSGYAALGTLFATQYGFATDNDYLRALGETGLLGLLSFMLIFVCYFRVAIRFVRDKAFPIAERTLVIGCLAAMLGFFANAVFIDVFEASKLAVMFWLFIGIVYGVISNRLKGNLN